MSDAIPPGASRDDELLAQAKLGPEASPFDYIVVGSGAGGGPLAARLALTGCRVLVIDAGGDPALEQSRRYPKADPGEVYACPGYHGAATEDDAMSWQFSVRHYADTDRQRMDEKYDQHDPPHARFLDPSRTGGEGLGGIFYPRSSGIGGCTSHHAMIVAIPNDRDWNHIADVTGDESWRADRMRGYFARLERCLYRDEYGRWLKRLLGVFYTLWQWLVLLFDPRAVLDEGGHGRHGWQPTTFIDPNLIEGIKRQDRGFTSLLIGSALAVLHRDNRLIGMLKRSLIALRVVQHIDPNDQNTRRTSPEGVFLIPTGIESGDAVDERGRGLVGRRVGVREFLLDTRAQHPDRLVLKTRTHVTRVLFAQPRETASGDEPDETQAPKAIGVEAAEGAWLYEASPLRRTPPEPPTTRVRYFARREVILCGGAFNTPQLLMLSGIGDANELAKNGTSACVLHDAQGLPLRSKDGAVRRIHLPGVGQNLQDRYEVSVISELDREFTSLENVSFAPGDENDPVRREWLRNGGGLYRTNGGTLAVLRRSSALGPTDPEPDLFVFGVPAAFRGYYFGYSRELLRRTIGAPHEQRNLWSWIILKAYTRNQAGTVTLRSADPFVQPQICFDSFNEKAERDARDVAAEIAAHERRREPVPAEVLAREARARDVLAYSERDLDALVDAVAYMRAVNGRNPDTFVHEVQPGEARGDGSEALKEWIRTQAWGHHASCTCRMGSDEWREDPALLRDQGAVLDSRFRVHGVKGLRVVDASVFPAIPGYFILAPILMISEKAADVLLEDARDSIYPPAFKRMEGETLRSRRHMAHRMVREPDPETAAAQTAADLREAVERRAPETGDGCEQALPPNAVGLALSGGGIRSATFALGVLQALARRDRLRDVDFLSTVSGGGFIGSFLGRLFTRDLVTESADPVGRVQDVLLNTRSGPVWWLRTQANYIFAAGSADVRQNLAVLWRNVLSLHLVVGALLFAAFGALALAAPALSLSPGPTVRGIALSPWWWIPVVAFALGVLPATTAFWLSPRTGSYRPYPVRALVAWLVLVAGALWMLQVPNGVRHAGAGLLVLLVAWLWQDAARWGNAPDRELRETRQRFRRSQGPRAREELLHKKAQARQQVGTIVRNRLTRGLGEAVAIFVFLVAFVLLDSLALLFARDDMPAAGLAALVAALGPLLPLLRHVGTAALRQVSAEGKEGFSYIRTAQLLGIPLAVLLLWVVDALAHRLVLEHATTAVWLVLLAVAFSIVIGRAFEFLNLSALRATYAARLSRTFLGASNPARVFDAPTNESRDVQLAHPNDDVAYDQYHPERYGGPIHLINVCINETVDYASEREVRERKGVSMCVTPHGVSVGRRYFARWTTPDALPRWQKRRRWFDGLDADDARPAERRRHTALRAIPVSSDPNAFHVLGTKGSESAEVEPLSLATWTAISGAAFSTGTGRNTTLALSLFMGLTNVRLGYWWDSGILARERPGRYPPSFWRRLKRLPSQAFCVQSMLLAEWRGRFRGPSQWFWYLSDGGHFEVTGLYELVRRRVPFMIVVDAGEDPDYRFGDLAQLTRQVRQDFGAEIEWLAALPERLPGWIRAWFDPAAIGPIGTLGKDSGHHAALACVTYRKSPADRCWILIIKPGVDAQLTEDVRNYAKEHRAFPQESTFDQVFDDNQWESYRALGEQIGRRVLRRGLQ